MSRGHHLVKRWSMFGHLPDPTEVQATECQFFGSNVSAQQKWSQLQKKPNNPVPALANYSSLLNEQYINQLWQLCQCEAQQNQLAMSLYRQGKLHLLADQYLLAASTILESQLSDHAWQNLLKKKFAGQTLIERLRDIIEKPALVAQNRAAVIKLLSCDSIRGRLQLVTKVNTEAAPDIHLLLQLLGPQPDPALLQIVSRDDNLWTALKSHNQHLQQYDEYIGRNLFDKSLQMYTSSHQHWYSKTLARGYFSHLRHSKHYLDQRLCAWLVNHPKYRVNLLQESRLDNALTSEQENNLANSSPFFALELIKQKTSGNNIQTLADLFLAKTEWFKSNFLVEPHSAEEHEFLIKAIFTTAKADQVTALKLALSSEERFIGLLEKLSPATKVVALMAEIMTRLGIYSLPTVDSAMADVAVLPKLPVYQI